MMEQGSLEWRKARLGKFNGSEVGDLMGVPRTKGKQFTDTALKLIYKVAAERHLSFLLDMNDEIMEEFLNRGGVENFAIRWGKNNEANAVNALAEMLKAEGHKFTVDEAGSVIHEKITTLAASPDRILTYEDGTRLVVEIKCPYIPANAYLAMKTVFDWESLKKWDAKYYWQVVAEIACNKASGAQFCIYDPHQEEPLHPVFLERDESAELQLLNKVIEAEQYISENL